jgi:sulfonate transport system ATP-binding protein
MNDLAPAAHGVAITAHGLRRAFGSLEVLRGLDLDVAAGSFVAIVGRSGCGKSTLLRLLAGLDRADAGNLLFGPGDSRARLMFQEPRLLPWASVLANVEIGLGPHPGPDRGRAAAALAAVGLADKAAAWPAALSGGQRQRVALARALVSRPRFLALDEPLGSLDALTRIEMQRLLESVWQEQGFTAVLVTHDVAEALALADRVVMIEHGTIALDLEIDLPRPRRRGLPAFGALEERILARLLG